jgi:hypothetical protein
MKINMVMCENKAEVLFFDRESAEKFFKTYNRLGNTILRFENKMILFELIVVFEINVNLSFSEVLL